MQLAIDTDNAFVASKQRVNLPTVALDCQPLFRQQNCERGIKEWWKSILVCRNLPGSANSVIHETFLPVGKLISSYKEPQKSNFKG